MLDCRKCGAPLQGESSCRFCGTVGPDGKTVIEIASVGKNLMNVINVALVNAGATARVL